MAVAVERNLVEAEFLMAVAAEKNSVEVECP